MSVQSWGALEEAVHLYALVGPSMSLHCLIASGPARASAIDGPLEEARKVAAGKAGQSIMPPSWLSAFASPGHARDQAVIVEATSMLLVKLFRLLRLPEKPFLPHSLEREARG